jgi:hypothetical protein
LLIVVILALAAAVAVSVRWVATRVDVLGRRRSFPIIGTAVPLVIALAAGIPVLRHARLEARLASVASTLAGHRVSVRCETLSQAWTDAHSELGYVRFGADGRPEPLATLTVQACGDLSDWLGSDRAHPPLRQVVAVHVLTHEAMHLTGQADEASAECAAVQRDALTSTLLGATPAQARALAAVYWRVVYPTVPDAYRSAGCAAGGSLDETLPDAPWVAVKSG